MSLRAVAARSHRYPICDELAAWVPMHSGAQRWILDPAFTTTRSLPKTIEPAVDPGFAPLTSVPVPERALVDIPRARLRGTSERGSDVALVVLPDDGFVGELVALTSEGRRAMLEPEPAYRRRLTKHPERRPGSYYAFLGFGIRHYYHWCHDQIMSARGIADLVPADARLIVPTDLKPFQAETLDLLGLGDRPRVAFPHGAYWELEHLYVVTPRLKTAIDSSEPYRWFRDAVMARWGLRERAPTRRLLLSRRNDGHWRTTNEPEVEELLAGYGFETVTPARLSLREQAELFGEAEVVVGTGAGLFNMVFSPPGTKVLQFQESGHMVHALWTQAAALGLEYHYMLCDHVPARGPIGDLHVPIAKLRTALDALDLR